MSDLFHAADIMEPVTQNGTCRRNLNLEAFGDLLKGLRFVIAPDDHLPLPRGKMRKCLRQSLFESLKHQCVVPQFRRIEMRTDRITVIGFQQNLSFLSSPLMPRKRINRGSELSDEIGL